MDLSGNQKLITTWEIDPDTDLCTVTFKKIVGLNEVLLGDMVLEKNRIRSMIEALGEVSREVAPESVDQEGHRTFFDEQTGKATTEFTP